MAPGRNSGGNSNNAPLGSVENRGQKRSLGSGKLLNFNWTGAHLANFEEKVHKPQSKTDGRIGANMQLIFHISY